MHVRYHGNLYLHRIVQSYLNTLYIAIRTVNRWQKKKIGVIHHRLLFMARIKHRLLNDIM